MKLFDQHGESIDMLLTDMRMPYMGGAELAHHLRGRRRTLKLLCISGYPGNLDAELAVDFLAKPFSRDELLQQGARSARQVATQIVRMIRSRHPLGRRRGVLSCGRGRS